MSISQNTQNCDETRSVKKNLKIIKFQEISWIGENSEILPRKPNMRFLISKPRNHGKNERSLETHELGQEAQVTSHWSYSTQ